MSKTNEKIEEVVKAVDEKMGEGYEVFSNVVQKNNGVKMTAVCIKADKNKIVPNTYIDKYLECMEVEEIADIVCESYMENKETEFDVDCISDKSFILENVIFQMVNKKKNQDMLYRIPYLDFMDLAAIFRVIVSSDEVGNSSYILSHQIMVLSDIGFKELKEAATKNTLELGVTCISLEEMMMQLFSDGPKPDGNIDDVTFHNGTEVYVLSNKNCMNGASLMMYSSVLGDIANKAGGDLYILPSSIHEVLVTPVNENVDVDFLKHMVNSVNV